MIKSIFASALMIFTAFTVGCVSSNGQSAAEKTNLTYGAVKSQIKKGETNQQEVIQLLGSPNITTKNKQGDEVWTYSKTASKSESAKSSGSMGILGVGAAVIGAGGVSGSKAVDTNSVSTFDLIITFDQNDVVKDYSIVTSKF